MRIVFHSDFRKYYKKLRKSERQRTDERIRLFEQNSFHPLLNNHALHHPYEGCRSINIMGDLRAIFREMPPDTVHFIIAGTHTELYG